jgi:UDP-N-acetylglucosamine 2-epimerase (non-hydrolysing)
MGVSCLTLRDHTERPETATVGTNELIGTNPASLVSTLTRPMSGQRKNGAIPEKRDGKAAELIVEILA